MLPSARNAPVTTRKITSFMTDGDPVESDGDFILKQRGIRILISKTYWSIFSTGLWFSINWSVFLIRMVGLDRLNNVKCFNLDSMKMTLMKMNLDYFYRTDSDNFHIEVTLDKSRLINSEIYMISNWKKEHIENGCYHVSEKKSL